MSGKIWNRINRFLVRDKVNVWVPYLLTCLGGITILLGLWFFAHNQAADIDEGFYAYEGYLYSLGKYTLFQDYGFPANQMPLAEKRKFADYVIDTSGIKQNTVVQVRAVYNSLRGLAQ